MQEHQNTLLKEMYQLADKYDTQHAGACAMLDMFYFIIFDALMNGVDSEVLKKHFIQAVTDFYYDEMPGKGDSIH